MKIVNYVLAAAFMIGTAGVSVSVFVTGCLHVIAAAVNS